MPQLKEILATEQARESAEMCTTIHLFREGTFYRAYEWSAWLCVRHFTELKVTHRLLKGGEDIVFVGFPLTSIERYTPREATVRPVDDKVVEVSLPATELQPDADIEAMRADFANWKQCQPLTDASKKMKEEKARSERSAPPRLTDIMRNILSYPIEQHSPMECMDFLSDVKKQISGIL